MSDGTTAIVAVTRGGVAVARRLREGLPGTRVVAPVRFAAEGEETYEGSVIPVIADAFHASRALVLVMASGIVVRAVAPLLRDKRSDPAIVVVDDAARFAISLVGGHLGGANALAEAVARVLNATPVVTTGSEAAGVLSPDMIGRDCGWRIDPCSNVTRVAAALVNGEPVGVLQLCGRTGWLPEPPPRHVTVYPQAEALNQARPAAALVVSDSATPGIAPGFPAVLYRPTTLVLGAGASRGAPADELIGLASTALANAGYSELSVGAVASIDLKRDEPGIVALAEYFGVPLLTFPACELRRVPGGWTRSDIVARAVGVGGVCEPAAIAAAHGGSLVVPKRKSAHATIAIARCSEGL